MSATCVSALGLSVNMGVAADRMRAAGERRWQIYCVVASIVSAAMAVLMAYSLGAVVGLQ